MKQCAFALFLLLCACRQNEPVFFLPPLAVGSLAIEFNGRLLAGSPGIPPQASSDRTAGLMLAGPLIENGCLSSHHPALFPLERGLRFYFCLDGLAGVRPEESNENPLVGSGVYTRTEVLEMFRSRASISLNERDGLTLPADQELYGGSVQETDIPAVFPALPVLRADGESVSFVSLHENRYRVLRINSPAIAAEFRRALRALPELRMIQGTSSVYVSEIFPGSGGSFELSSHSDGRISTLITLDSSPLLLQGYAFRGTALLPGLPLRSEISLDGTTLRRGDLPFAGEHHSWSLDRESVYAPSVSCERPGTVQKPACHSRGFSPETAELSGILQANDQYCTPADFRLSEINPFGFDFGGLNPGGKFLELEVLRPCWTGRIALYAPGPVDPGQIQVEPGILLFTADSQYFEHASIESSELRSLSPDRSAAAVSLSGRASAQLFAPYPSGDLWIPRSPAGVHSLIPGGPGLVFHGPAAQGLRPDVRAAMSPGSIVRTARGSARLTELYPTGSHNGTSIAADEFFEIEGSAGEGMLVLEVRRLRDSKTIRHRLPPPDGLHAYAAAAPVCFSYPWIKSELFLPNEAALYSADDGLSLTQITIDAAQYSRMETSRASLGQFDRSWELSRQNSWCAKAAASPAQANEAAP